MSAEARPGRRHTEPPELERPAGPARERARVHPAIDRAAAYSWRILVIVAVGVAVLWLIGQTRVAVFPVIVALFLTRALHPIAVRLRRRGWKPALAATTTLLGFVVALGLAGALIVPAIADQFSDLGPTISEAGDYHPGWGSPRGHPSGLASPSSKHLSERTDRARRGSGSYYNVKRFVPLSVFLLTLLDRLPVPVH